MDNPSLSLDKLLLLPIRLAAIAHLDRAGGTAPLTEIRAVVGKPSHALMCMHNRVLEGAAYIEQQKYFEGRVPRTRLVLAARGRDAFHRHRAALAYLTEEEVA